MSCQLSRATSYRILFFFPQDSVLAEHTGTVKVGSVCLVIHAVLESATISNDLIFGV
jgi:hypothetical protein